MLHSHDEVEWHMADVHNIALSKEVTHKSSPETSFSCTDHNQLLRPQEFTLDLIAEQLVPSHHENHTVGFDSWKDVFDNGILLSDAAALFELSADLGGDATNAVWDVEALFKRHNSPEEEITFSSLDLLSAKTPSTAHPLVATTKETLLDAKPHTSINAGNL